MAIQRKFTKPRSGYSPGDKLSTSDAAAELAKRRRINQYSIPVFPKKSSGGGGSATKKAFESFQDAFNKASGEIFDDIEEIEQAYRMGLLPDGGAQRDAYIIDKLNQYKQLVNDMTDEEQFPIIAAYKENAPTTVSNWMDKVKELEQTNLSSLGYNEEGEGPEDRVLFDREGLILKNEDSDGNVNSFKYSYSDYLVDESGRVNENLDRKGVAIDVWTDEGFQQITLDSFGKTTSGIEFDYQLGNDPYTNEPIFYLVEKTKINADEYKAQEIGNLNKLYQAGEIDDQEYNIKKSEIEYATSTPTESEKVWLKGPNNLSVEANLLRGEDGSVQYQYKPVKGINGEDVIETVNSPKMFDDTSFKAYMMGKTVEAYKGSTNEEKEAIDKYIKQISYNNYSMPVKDDWIEGADGSLYFYDGEKLRPVEKNEAWLDIANSYGYNEEVSPTKKMPGLFFLNEELIGDPLRDKSVEEFEDIQKETSESISFEKDRFSSAVALSRNKFGKTVTEEQKEETVSSVFDKENPFDKMVDFSKNKENEQESLGENIMSPWMDKYKEQSEMQKMAEEPKQPEEKTGWMSNLWNKFF